MPDAHSTENEYLKKVTRIIEENLSNEQFGVSELARELAMSRSNLLRKINKLAGMSVSQFIRQVRLRKAMEILRQEKTLTVSEVSYRVGFNSVSYFIKCFHEQYGFPPGEAGKQTPPENHPEEQNQHTHTHQLAAIMFTDIQGYTALMQQDEQKAVEFRARHRQIFNEITGKFKGKILQYYGDGTLSTFKSAIDAVRCGVELQFAFLLEPKIPVRIGIHSGDIIFTDDDIIGDGVNVASRIESLAVSGSVFISEKVFDEVKNQPGITTKSMGTFELKNVGKALEVFAITNEGLVVPKPGQITGNVIKMPSAGLNELPTKPKRSGLKWVFLFVLLSILAYFVFTTDIYQAFSGFINSADETVNRKSIAVLPFRNDSNDSSNVYLINGLMESVLNNLQKIEDLSVKSRTSVEKYRNSAKTIPEIARELNVKYFVEGSGQKIGDQILLNIQLIDGQNDRHLWAEQYNRETTEIFKLQREVAKNIAGKIQVIITPEEEEQINKIPTNNLVAYDYFLKGLDYFYIGTGESLLKAIEWFEKAIAEDKEFARAYADAAIAYYFLDAFQTEKKYSAIINDYSDKALLYDSKLAQSLVAKALFYMNGGDYQLAIPYLEKALEYNPNSAMVINILSDFYATKMPDTEKYLEYALKGIQLDVGANDSATTSFIFLHLSNAFIQSGFVDEAIKYVNLSLDYNPENLYSAYVKAYILLAKNNNLKQAKKRIVEALNKDTTRLDIMQEAGKVCYYLRDYQSAYMYYKKFVDSRKAYGLNIYKSEDAKIAFVYAAVGKKAEADELFDNYKRYAENDNSIYKDINLAMYYAYQGNSKKAIEHLKMFSREENYFYWIVLFLAIDPLVDNIKSLPEFKRLIKEIDERFWARHTEIKSTLEEKGLI